MDFQRLLHNCRAIRTTYSKPFNGVPDSINFSADGKQVLFLSSGSLYSDELKAEEDDLIDGTYEVKWGRFISLVKYYRLLRAI